MGSNILTPPGQGPSSDSRANLQQLRIRKEEGLEETQPEQSDSCRQAEVESQARPSPPPFKIHIYVFIEEQGVDA